MTINWTTEKRAVTSLKDYPRNPRIFTEKGMADLRASLKSLGYIDPIAINKDGTIIGGHARKHMLLELGLSEVDVRVPDRQLTTKQVEEAIIRLNKNTAGEWDFKMLEDSFIATDLFDWGFEKSDFNAYGASQDSKDDIAPAAPPSPITSLGDLWLMGNHRLFAGSAAEPDHIAALLNGVTPHLLFTDPPYGIKMDKGFRGSDGFGGNGKKISRRKYADNWDSERPSDKTFQLILSIAAKSIIFGGNFFADLLPAGKHWIVWDKLNTMPTFGDCELAWTNIKRDSVKKVVIEYNGLIGREKERYHPTQKPVALAEWVLENYTKEGDSVVDLFMGSGTALIAAEKKSRLCYGMEISPHYCDVIVTRWQNFTGKKAYHAVTGTAFNDHIPEVKKKVS